MSNTEKRNLLREYLIKWWYRYISRIDKDAELIFLNYGYSCNTLDLQLDKKLEPLRYPIQLYHQISSKVDLKDQNILEVGCGRGGGLSYIMDSFSPKNAIGIDLNPDSVKFCANHYKKPGLSFMVANAENLPFDDNSLDVVINVESSHRYGDMQKFITEVKRVLKPGGYFLLTDFRHDFRMRYLNETLANSGLVKIMEEYITEKVLDALRKDEIRRRNLVTKLLPKLFHNIGLSFATVEGTKTFNGMISGRIHYFNYVLRKDN